MSTLGEKLLAIRNRKGLLQEEVVIELNRMFDENISASMLSRWERNRANPSLDSLRKLSSYYKVSMDYLLGTDLGNEESIKMRRDEVISEVDSNLKNLCNILTQLSEENRNIVSTISKSLLEKQKEEKK